MNEEVRPFRDVVLLVSTSGDPSVGINGWHATVTITAVLAEHRADVIRSAKTWLPGAFHQVFEDGKVHIIDEDECR